MKKLLLTILMILTAYSFGEDLTVVNNYSSLGDMLIAQADDEQVPTDNQPVKQSVMRQKYRDGKSPLIAAGLSLLIPGAGEIYGESYWRAGIFVGIEATTLGLWYMYENDGDDKTDDFHKYANTNFSRDMYFKGIEKILTEYDIAVPDSLKLSDLTDEDGNNVGIANLTDIRNGIYGEQWSALAGQRLNKSEYLSLPGFTHDLPQTKTQQYYEMIGKYHQFSMGWKDFNGWADEDNDGVVDLDENGLPIAKLRDEHTGKKFYEVFEKTDSDGYLYDSASMVEKYEGMRDDANVAYETGQTFLMLTLINHVASAFDATFLIKSDFAIESTIRIDQPDKEKEIGFDNFKVTYALSF
ncbi:MAG: hypothetical protein JXR48_11455 [Candidatus Delongbacteria bacterium]|nr:hypothetical protein [Candidatus Delongbacteria bacterium]MBN2835568.1 hypothetical protein [Candidatus Delongbacteria bacterium]